MSASLIFDQWTLLILIWSINFVISILGIANKTKQLYIPPNFKEREISGFGTVCYKGERMNRGESTHQPSREPTERGGWLAFCHYILLCLSNQTPVWLFYSSIPFNTHYDNTRSYRKEKNRGREKNRSTLLAALTTKMHSVTITIVLTVISVASSKREKKNWWS